MLTGTDNATHKNIDYSEADDAEVSEAGVVGNSGSVPKQQRKRNGRKANAAKKEKTEAKGKQTKGKSTVDEDEMAKGWTTEDEAIEKMNETWEEGDSNVTVALGENDQNTNKVEDKHDAVQAALAELLESAEPTLKTEILDGKTNASTDLDED